LKIEMRKYRACCADGMEARFDPEADLYALTITNGNPRSGMAATEGACSPSRNAKRPEDRIMARAKLAATYAGLLGRHPLPPVYL